MVAVPKAYVYRGDKVTHPHYDGVWRVYGRHPHQGKVWIEPYDSIASAIGLLTEYGMIGVWSKELTIQTKETHSNGIC